MTKNEKRIIADFSEEWYDIITFSIHEGATNSFMYVIERNIPKLNNDEAYEDNDCMYYDAITEMVENDIELDTTHGSQLTYSKDTLKAKDFILETVKMCAYSKTANLNSMSTEVHNLIENMNKIIKLKYGEEMNKMLHLLIRNVIECNPNNDLLEDKLEQLDDYYYNNPLNMLLDYELGDEISQLEKDIKSLTNEIDQAVKEKLFALIEINI